MPSFGKHRYLVLDDTLSSSEIPNLLGILVVDAANPLSISAPKITEEVATRLKEYTLEPVSQKNVSDVLQEAHSSSLFVCLEKIFNLAASKGRQTKLDLKTARVRTISLKSHDQVFDWMKKNCAAEIKAFLDENWRKRAVYMIVGFKTITDANIRISYTAGQTASMEAKVPVIEMAGATAGAPVVPANTGNPSISLSATRCEGVLSEATYEDEQVFAVQYRKIKRGPFLRRLLTRRDGCDPIMGELQEFRGGKALGAVGSGGSGEESSDDEDDEDDLSFEFPTVDMSAICDEERGEFNISQGGKNEEFLYRSVVSK